MDGFVLPEGAEQELQWTSEDPAVASVSKQGEITAGNAGKTKVYAQADGKMAVCSVTVLNEDTLLHTFTASFTGGEGASGVAPLPIKAMEGSRIVLPQNTFMKQGYSFVGWSDGERIYRAGASYTMPGHGVMFEAEWTPVNALTVKLTASPVQQATSGEQVKLKAKASGGSGGYTYKFLVCDEKNNWYKIQDYSEKAEAVWTTGATGKKTLYVDVKDSAGCYKRTGISFVVIEEMLRAELSAAPARSAESGENVKLTVTAEGGYGKYEYAFLVSDGQGNWYRIREYGTSGEVVWKTGSSGEKTLYADVRDERGVVIRCKLEYNVN